MVHSYLVALGLLCASAVAAAVIVMVVSYIHDEIEFW